MVALKSHAKFGWLDKSSKVTNPLLFNFYCYQDRNASQPQSVILVDKPVIHITEEQVISGKFAVSIQTTRYEK